MLGHHSQLALIALYWVSMGALRADAQVAAAPPPRLALEIEAGPVWLSYRQRFHHGARWSWWWGLTAKIRDAQIALAQGDVSAAKDDLGFVPLAHLAWEWRPAANWRATFDADALAGGPGRAEDVALKLSRDLGERTRLAVGYRMVEGGADVDEVYNFAWLHYAVASLYVSF